MPKIVYCWRCRADVPMLDEAEWEHVFPRLEKMRERIQTEGISLRDAKEDSQGKGAVDRYFKLTGHHVKDARDIWYHRLSRIGPSCESCGKPLRTRRAKLCAECGTPKSGPPSNPPTMQIKLTPEDYIAANYLHARWLYGSWRFWSLTTTVLAALGLALVILFPNGGVHDAGGIILISLAVFWILMPVTRYWLLPRRHRHSIAQNKKLLSPIAVEWANDKVTFESGEGVSRYAWSDFSKWRESEHLILLYDRSNRMFRLIPKRSFPDQATLEGFRELVRANLGKPS